MEKEAAFHTTDGRHAEHLAKRKEVLMLKSCMGSRGYLIHLRLLNKPYQLQKVLQLIRVGQESITGVKVHMCFNLLLFFPLYLLWASIQDRTVGQTDPGLNQHSILTQ